MAEQWISASLAYDIAGGRSPLCGRLHVGLIKSRARLLTIEDRQFEHAPVPKEFWWALGHEALEQNWETGDFSTQLKGSGRAQAFGVTFPLSSVLELSAVEDRSKLARRSPRMVECTGISKSGV